MTTPTITSYPGTIPAKGQSNTVFDTNVDAYLVWLSTLNIPELQILAPWIAGIRDEVAATALSGTLPDITGRAADFVRVNAGETAMEFRTAVELLGDIGGAPINAPALTGVPTAPTAVAGTNTTQLATTAFVSASAKKRFSSAAQTIVSAELRTIAHGLGVAPTSVSYRLECLTAEGGYSVGDVAAVYSNNSDESTGRYNTARLDSTNVYIRFTPATQCFLAGNPTTGGYVILTNANWQLFVEAYE
tara:strand:- start:514 stop:1251 length:738 start_codon:yes stop_codon:yes gene_type:complete